MACSPLPMKPILSASAGARYLAAIAPVLEELATEYAGKLKIAKVDVDSEPDLAHRFNVVSIPTLLLFKDSVRVRLVPWLVSFAVYVKTQAPTFSFWDCGEFITSAFKLEVGHPPGAPTFIILGRI